MFSTFTALSVRKLAVSTWVAAAVALSASPAEAQFVSFLGVPAGGQRDVCVSGTGQIYVINSSESCTISDPADVEYVDGLDVANATFNQTTNRTDIAGGTLLVNGVTTTFSGGTTSFFSPVTFNGPSTVTFDAATTFADPSTFNALADFNNGITSNTITNSGTVSTATLNATTVSAGTIVGTSVTASGALLVSPASNVDMGNNVVHFVAAGVANTDAVNVGQLNAATADITTDVTALETLTATHTTQITNLEAADMAFDNRITTLELTATELNERIGDVDDRASAGTAAAVALSGAMFLPGKSFNLTGNIGSYRGAHAAALQFGALVSDNVALNAGVAHGFNKGGKTALRAGFTVGW